jgi:hypothetical protein
MEKGKAAAQKVPEDKVLKWLTTQEKFIQLERDAEAAQTEQLLQSLPRKVLFFFFFFLKKKNKNCWETT